MSIPAYAYLRISGEGQKQGTGLDRQIETIRAFATGQYEIISIFQDVETGTSPALSRPAFATMIAGLNGIKTILIERLDRLARSMLIQEQTVLWLAANEIELVVADTGENVTEAYRADPAKRAVMQMRGVFSELEKSMIVKKLRLAREKLRQEGKCEGRKAYGEEDEREYQAVLRIRQLRRKRKKLRRRGYRAIAKILQGEGWPTRMGRPWHPQTVCNIIKGKVYKGLGKKDKM